MPKVRIEKIVFGGQGLARTEEGVIFVWGGLPGEEVEVEITDRKKNFSEGIVTKIYQQAPERIEPLESHYHSCGPWQIMTPEAEDYWKLEATKEMFQKSKVLTGDVPLELISDQNNFFHYRNKIEYNFCLNDEGQVSYAFFKRDSHDLVAIDECELATPAIAKAAQKVLAWIRQFDIALDVLDRIVFRSNEKGEAMAALFVHKKIALVGTPAWDENLVSFQIYVSSDKTLERFFSQGKKTLVEKFSDLTLRFDALSFFQINWPIFAQALTDIQALVPPDSLVVDYYAGVGTIGLALASKAQKVLLVESDANAINLARQNIQDNKLENCNVERGDAGTLLNYITKSRTVIFDPPRAGLSDSVIKRILDQKPKQIIYLSCEPSTQARDCLKLQNFYHTKMMRLYNFFPRTPHVESLWVLERK